MRCRGAGDQICGGPNALSLYNNTGYVSPGPAPRVGKYDSLGCVSDPSNGGRALQGASTTDPQMSNEKCVKFCLGKGFHYAGIEFGTECKSSPPSLSSSSTSRACVYVNADANVKGGHRLLRQRDPLADGRPAHRLPGAEHDDVPGEYPAVVRRT